MAAIQKEELTTGTLDGLELRLRKIENLVGGYADGALVVAPESKDATVAARVERLELALHKLGAASRPVADLLRLYKEHPDLFPSSTTLPPPSSFNTREKLAMVNSCAAAFSTTASQLTSVQDSPIPSAESSTALIALQPRLAAAEQKQAQQGRELAELRLQTARVLQRWYDVTVIGSNECWAEWDERLMEAEMKVRRQEAVREAERGPM